VLAKLPPVLIEYIVDWTRAAIILTLGFYPYIRVPSRRSSLKRKTSYKKGMRMKKKRRRGADSVGLGHFNIENPWEATR
jgi:hypothetical protein